ncbi:MAG TPA: metallophosphoesterase [bacterium]|nr:metallophosphoesterase [bacterium]
MSILAVSDEVDEALLGETRPERLAGVRLIISCGDLPPEYLEFLVERFAIPLLYVRGNHDLRYAASPPPGENIHSRLVTVAGLRILGFEGSMWYNGEGVQYTEREMWWRVLWAAPSLCLSRGVDVVVTHAPPHGIHDGDDRAHTGFRVFRKLLHTLRPRYFVHGHNHLSYVAKGERISAMGTTQVVNAYRSVVLPIEVASTSSASREAGITTGT